VAQAGLPRIYGSFDMLRALNGKASGKGKWTGFPHLLWATSAVWRAQKQAENLFRSGVGRLIFVQGRWRMRQWRLKISRFWPNKILIKRERFSSSSGVAKSDEGWILLPLKR
jgi:hypothetical protein